MTLSKQPSEMCGIAVWIAAQNTTLTDSKVDHAARKIQHRGPDQSQTLIIGGDGFCRMDFHRLAINGFDSTAMQPFKAGPWHVVVNGEIYNSETLATRFNLCLASGSDCEVVARMLQANIAPLKVCDALDGVFAFAAYNEETKRLVAARDPFGVRSLYIAMSYNGVGPRMALASELKVLVSGDDGVYIAPFPPGKMFQFDVNTQDEQWFRHHVGFETNFFPYFDVDDREAMSRIRMRLVEAVDKRVQCDRLPIGCFVSGGLDSSLIAALVVRAVCVRGGKPEDVWTFSIGQEGSTDMRFAQMVADHLKTTHHPVFVTEQQMLDAIPNVVKSLETWDTTTIRAATGHCLLSNYVRDNTPVKVLFSGEGADEIMGSYLYFENAPTPEAFQDETMRLARDLHRFDVLRVELSCASRGLKCRVPFLDKFFVATALRVPPQQRGFRDFNGRRMEKWLLRKAFDGDELLPKQVLWRRKEAFSDGVSSATSSWHHQIQRHAARMYPESATENNYNTKTPEQQWYQHLFEQYYPGCAGVIPYEWLPKWCGGQTDPSARALVGYSVN